MKSEELFTKIYRVIHSCETLEQLNVAYKYLGLAQNNGYIAPEFRTAIFFSIYTDKQNELMK